MVGTGGLRPRPPGGRAPTALLQTLRAGRLDRVVSGPARLGSAQPEEGRWAPGDD